ncbi:MAG: hypothetical protein ABS909_03295, partial [Arthrobacter sp.]
CGLPSGTSVLITSKCRGRVRASNPGRVPSPAVFRSWTSEPAILSLRLRIRLAGALRTGVPV